MQNYKTPKKKSFWGRLINKSIIASLLTYLSVRFHYFLSDSFVARIFNISDKADSLSERSVCGSLYSKFNNSPVFSKLRHTFSKNVESSRLVGIYRTFVSKVITSSVRSTGVFFLSGGMYSLLGYIMKWVQNGADFRTYYELVIIAFFIIIGVSMLFSQRSNGRKLHESSFFSAVLFDFLGLNKLAVNKDAKSENHFLVAFFGGLVFGILSFVSSVISTLSFLITAIMLLIIVYSPESGILLSMILFPISNQALIDPILLASLISYVLKLMRGKRNLRFKSEDIASVFVSVIFILFYPLGNKSVTALLLTVYFMASNLMRSTEYLKKSVNALSLGLSINVLVVSINGIILRFGKMPSFLSIFTIYNPIEYYGYISVIALVFALYITTQKNSVFPFVYRLLFLISSVISVFLSASETVWYVALAVIFIYSVYSTLSLFNVAFVYLLILPLLGFVRSFASYVFDIKEFSLSLFKSPSKDIVNLLFGSDLLGENMSFSLFSAFGIFGCLTIAMFLYLLFSRTLSSSKRSRSVPREFCALATACISAFIAVGNISHKSDMLIFWTLCGLISAAGNIVPRFNSDDDYY